MRAFVTAGAVIALGLSLWGCGGGTGYDKTLPARKGLDGSSLIVQEDLPGIGTLPARRRQVVVPFRDARVEHCDECEQYRDYRFGRRARSYRARNLSAISSRHLSGN